MSETLPQKSNTDKILIVLLATSVLLNAWLFFDRSVQKQTTEKFIKELQTTQVSRDSLSGEFGKLYKEYDNLKTNNDTINAKLSAQQARIQTLLSEIKNVRGANAQLIDKYKKELDQLRQVMRGFVLQIDSLHTKNVALTEENKKIKTSYEKEQSKNQELKQNNENLSQTVEKAAVIKAFEIKVLGLNAKEKETNKAKKINKLEISFQLSENQVTEKGRKTIYVRVARPDGIILSKSATDLFDYNGNRIVFSAKRDVEYKGQQVPLSVYWTCSQEPLIEGKYTIDVFENGKRIGTSSVELK